MPACNTAGFPGFSKATYADVRAYFDSEERRTLTPAQYKRYVADSNRFD